MSLRIKSVVALSCGQSCKAPYAFSVKIRSHPAWRRASSCKSAFWSCVETRTQPINMYHISKTYLSICSDGHTFKILFYDIIALSTPNWQLMFVRHLKKDRLRDMHIWFVNRMAILVLINFFNVPCLWHIHYKMTKGGLHKNHIQRRPS